VIPSIWALNTGRRDEMSMSEMGHIATGRALKNHAAQTSRTYHRKSAGQPAQNPIWTGDEANMRSRIQAQWSILLTIRIQESNDWPLALQPLSSG